MEVPAPYPRQRLARDLLIIDDPVVRVLEEVFVDAPVVRRQRTWRDKMDELIAEPVERNVVPVARHTWKNVVDELVDGSQQGKNTVYKLHINQIIYFL